MAIHTRYLKLLTDRLPFYLSLHSSERKRTTALQRHFVDVSKGDARPRTDDELAFLLYLANPEAALGEIEAFRQRRHPRQVVDHGDGSPPRVQVGRTTSQKARDQLNGRMAAAPPPGEDVLAGPGSKRSIINAAHEGGSRPKLGPSKDVKRSPTPRIENPHARYIKETWGTRDDWRRDRAAYRSNARKDKLT